MRFTGHNLRWVQYGLDLALDEIHNRIATCPDVNEYAVDIAAYERQAEQIRRLLNKVNAVLGLPVSTPDEEEDSLSQT
jgi:hypothetical protein